MAEHTQRKYDLAAPGAFRHSAVRTLFLPLSAYPMITSPPNLSQTIGRWQSTLDANASLSRPPFSVFAVRTLVYIPINPHPMKKFLHSRDGASKGAALIIVLAFVVLATALGLAYFSRTTTDRQLAQSSYNDTSADLLARSALDITVSDLKQEIRH